MGALIQSFGNMGTAIIIAMITGWKLTLVILCIMPLIAMGGLMTVRLLAGMSGKNKEALENAGKIAVENIENIRTVASLNREEGVQKSYLEALDGAYKNSLKRAYVVGIGYGLSQASLHFGYAVAFYYGGELVEDRDMEYEEVFRIFGLIVFGAFSLGQASGFAPEYGKAKGAAKRVLHVIDSTPSLDPTLDIGDKPERGTFKSSIAINDVHFSYPTRPDVKVLQGLTLSVSQGQTVALVGSSGCGKSTCVGLLERFYETNSGTVHIDHHDVEDLNIQWLRQQMGLVSQEPSLFGCSIAENIAYGVNTRKVGMDEIIKAAKGANIHGFIEALPCGYDTLVGDRGTQLSGGQKQRIAIARALLREPKILLLDEATSALDTESEKIVQEALDNAKVGRTCITIAHRLATIQNADNIIVIDRGVVVEQGTHAELMAAQGFYYKLQRIQNRRR